MTTDKDTSRRDWSIIGALIPMFAVILVVSVRAWERPPRPAPGSQLVATVELREGPFEQLVLARLTVSEAVPLKLRLDLRQIDSPSLDLSLQNEDGITRIIMRAEGLRTSSEGGSDWEQTLPAGDYRLVLSAARSPGTLAIYAAEQLGLRIERPQPAGPERSRALPMWQDTVAPAHPLAAPAAAAFFDDLLPRQLERHHIPGAAVALVQDGQLLFAEGYGYADVEQRRPASAEQTLFRTGSVAKLFTWTAVMQLVERGQLDLHADVNSYLRGFRIPDTYPEPITLAHLLTHTAGFEDRSVGALRANPEDLEPAGDYLGRAIPARVYPPGQVSAYSNYGTALAGHIVAQVAGQPYEQYVEANIFTPLGMARTTVVQPVPAALAPDLATGYAGADGALRPQPFELFQIAAAGGASASAADMARFMIAHLEDGAYAEARILEPATERTMHARHFGNAPELAGVAYGFYELHLNERRLLTHAGDTSFFRSQIFLLPEERLGLYVVYNAPGGSPARTELAQAFFDRFYPAPDGAAPRPQDNAAPSEARLAGRYIPTRSAQTTVEKLRLLVDPIFQPLSVRVREDELLEITQPLARSRNPGAYQPQRWVALDVGHYQSVDRRDRAVFRSDAQGNLMLFLDSVPIRGHRKLAWHEAPMYEPLVPAGLALVSLLALGFAVFDRGAPRAPRRLALASGVALLLFLAGLVAFGLSGFVAYLYGAVSPLWWVVFALPVALIPLAISLAASSAWPSRGWSLARRLPYALAALALTALLWWAQYWNLLGWHP